MAEIRFWPDDHVTLPDGRRWTVAAVAMIDGERYTFLVRPNEVYMIPTYVLNAEAAAAS